jgi:putative ferrous iron transport protein C
MILMKVKEYLKTQRLVSLFDLTTRFNLDPEIVREMLKLFISKGKLRLQQKTARCGTQCAKCHPAMTELYEWVEVA